jgi:hypothetical protein
MSALNTAMNVIGTLSAAKSLFGEKPAAQNSKINNFISEISNRSVSRTNLFEVVITPPPVLQKESFVSSLILYAEGAQLPGLFIQTSDVKRYGIGPSEKVAYGSSVNDINMSFIGDGQGKVYQFFYKWLQSIVRSDYDIRSSVNVSAGGLNPFEVEFKENYQATITITTFNEQGTPVLSYKLINAFPTNIADIALNWGDSAQLMTIPISFTFFQSQLDTGEVGTTPTLSNDLSPFQKIVKAGTAIQAIASMRKPTSIGDVINATTNAKNVLSGYNL